MKNKIIGFLLLLLSTQICIANQGWYGPFSVTKIEAADAGVYFMKPGCISGFPNPFNCVSSDWIYFGNANKIGDRALSMGLTAQASGRKLNYYIVGCSGAYIEASIISIE